MSYLVRQDALKVPQLLVTNNSNLTGIFSRSHETTTFRHDRPIIQVGSVSPPRLRVFVVLSEFTCLRVGLQFGQDCSTLSCF